MSHYLVDRIVATAQHRGPASTPRSVAGARRRAPGARSPCATAATGADEEVDAGWLFVFIGAAPRTDWLGPRRRPRRRTASWSPAPTCGLGDAVPPWPLERTPYALETSVPGVFAAGDVRLDSMKRVASAVGEGAMAVYLVHRYLATV